MEGIIVWIIIIIGWALLRGAFSGSGGDGNVSDEQKESSMTN